LLLYRASLLEPNFSMFVPLRPSFWAARKWAVCVRRCPRGPKARHNDDSQMDHAPRTCLVWSKFNPNLSQVGGDVNMLCVRATRVLACPMLAS
jgi:hypothetical protein